MVARNQKAKDDLRKQDIKNFIKEHPGVQTSKIAKFVYVGHRRASTLLTMMVNTGELFRAGSHNSTGYWTSETAWRADWDSRHKPEAVAPVKTRPICMAPAKQYPAAGLIFLSRKRPLGTNTIFDECKHNSQILPVLRVMAARRVS